LRNAADFQTFDPSCEVNPAGGIYVAFMKQDQQVVETDIPARLDRLPWGRFHTLVVAALGITWILDGLEVTLAGSLAGALKTSLHLSNTDIGIASSAYLAGAVLGALFFGWLTDRLGRKKLFFITLSVYLVATRQQQPRGHRGFALFRFITGAGIGGGSTRRSIQRFRSLFRRGCALDRPRYQRNLLDWRSPGRAGSLVLLDAQLIDPDFGWRLGFLIGAGLACFIFLMRLWIPESPRWLMTHGHLEEAERVVAGIESRFAPLPTTQPLPRVRLRARKSTPLWLVNQTLFKHHRRRTFVGLSLMAAQAFFYNAIFFTYALILIEFYGVTSDRVGLYLLPFAIGNFLGPLLIGRLFDTHGRRIMIAFTYIVSGILLALTGWLFMQNLIDAITQTVCWTIIFFFASCAASSAYLTVSETFPLEIRALAIAFFYAVGTGIGGILAPSLFGLLIDTGSRVSVFWGYLFGSALMIFAGGVAWRWGINAERKPLEDVARPLTFV
jgi:MFS family permease